MTYPTGHPRRAPQFVGLLFVFLAFLFMQPGAAQAQSAPAQAAAPSPYGFADIADFAADAGAIIDARIRRVNIVESARAPGLAPGYTRFYVEGEVTGNLFGTTPVARRVAWLVDRPLAANGRPVRIARERVLLFTRTISDPQRLVLVSPGAMLRWDAAADTAVRSIAAERANGAPPAAITGIVRAMHVPGTVAGEGETQIFLSTANGNPVSLSMLRRPGQPRQWSVAFGEILDESAARPRPGSIGHYRLSCGLPRQIPQAALISGDAAADAIAREDYAQILSAIGACDRRLAPMR